LGGKHPWALGKPTRVVWSEIWRDLEPRIRTVLETGGATWDEALLLFLERSGYPEETYHTFSYSPLKDDDGRIAGMLCVVMEVTDRIIGERRLALLGTLASRLAATTGESEVFDAVRDALRANSKDLPFALTYLYDEIDRRAHLVSASGIEAGHAAAPRTIALDDPSAPWPLAEVAGDAMRRVVDDIDSRYAELPTGAWDRPPARAVIVRIARRGQAAPAGFLVVGLNPFRPFDAAYQDFVDLIAGQIASSHANARAYDEERRRVEALAELDRAKTTFFSNVSHEFRTPLTLLLAPIEDVLRTNDLPAEVLAEVSVAHRNGLRLLKLVNSLLDFSRIEAGRIQASYEPTDLGMFTTELASGFRSLCERAGLTLTVDAAPLHEKVYVDCDMWEKVVLNLLSNAFKHTFTGGITVQVRERDHRAELVVEDTGIGISADDLPRVFERFHRVPNARSRTHEGTGIGLALVQEIVRRHGGRIEVDSVVGRGTRFTVSLPFGHTHLPVEQVTRAADSLVSDRESARTRVAAAYVEEAQRWVPSETQGSVGVDADDPVAPTPTPQGSLGRILVADDNADMREYVSRLLRAQGWAVDAHGDGTAALDAVRNNRPDLVLSDILMPGLDGFGLLRALRNDKATATIPVILLSARAGEEARVEGAAAAADDYIVKPFSAPELVARVGAQFTLARERARAAASLRAARDLLRGVLEQAPVGICVLRGTEHVYELANAFYRRFLPSDREIIGRPVREVVPEAEAHGFVALLDGVRATGVPWIGRGVELVYDRHGNGQPESAFLNLLYYPLYSAANEIDGVIAVVSEVTDEVRARREADEARRDAEEARSDAEGAKRLADEARHVAERANQAKSDFLAVMSH
ncbi:MAG: Chemotaxis protein methyltransferase CheR, partial [Gemmatimonadetes bacterium]|nr:Chemotaxis protein methyltransferase CheR [Gemmatimonadota bacterium]